MNENLREGTKALSTAPRTRIREAQAVRGDEKGVYGQVGLPEQRTVMSSLLKKTVKEKAGKSSVVLGKGDIKIQRCWKTPKKDWGSIDRSF